MDNKGPKDPLAPQVLKATQGLLDFREPLVTLVFKEPQDFLELMELWVSQVK